MGVALGRRAQSALPGGCGPAFWDSRIPGEGRARLAVELATARSASPRHCASGGAARTRTAVLLPVAGVRAGADTLACLRGPAKNQGRRVFRHHVCLSKASNTGRKGTVGRRARRGDPGLVLACPTRPSHKAGFRGLEAESRATRR